MASSEATLAKFFGQPVKGPLPPPPQLLPKAECEAESEAVRPKGTPTKRRRTSGAGAAADAAYTTPAKGRKSKAAAVAAESPGVKGSGNAVQRRKRTQRGKTAAWGNLRSAGMKCPKSSYAMWCADNRKGIAKAMGLTDFAEISRAVGDAWMALTEEDKKPYILRREEAMAKFAEARAAYKEYAKEHAKLKSFKVARPASITKAAKAAKIARVSKGAVAAAKAAPSTDQAEVQAKAKAQGRGRKGLIGRMIAKVAENHAAAKVAAPAEVNVAADASKQFAAATQPAKTRRRRVSTKSTEAADEATQAFCSEDLMQTQVY